MLRFHSIVHNYNLFDPFLVKNWRSIELKKKKINKMGDTQKESKYYERQDEPS